MRRLHAVFLLSLLWFGAASKLDRLTDAEQDHYRALRIFMEEKDQKAWLKLKTEEERNAWLQEQKLWDRFYSLTPEQREMVVAGEVKRGFSRDMVYMAWGNPFQKQRLTGREAERSEMLVYRFEVDKDGYASPMVGKKPDYKAVDRYQVEVLVDDDVVAEIIEKDDWE